MRELIRYTLWFILVLLVQVFVFDQLILPGGFVISIYTLFILILPFKINKILLILAAFAMGLAMDAFNDTFGLHASSAVALGYFRYYVYKWFEPVVGYSESQSPNLNDMGWNWTLKTYIITIAFFHTWFYALSFLRLIGPWFTAQKILFSTLVTLLVILVIQVLYQRRVNKNEL